MSLIKGLSKFVFLLKSSPESPGLRCTVSFANNVTAFPFEGDKPWGRSKSKRQFSNTILVSTTLSQALCRWDVIGLPETGYPPQVWVLDYKPMGSGLGLFCFPAYP